LSCSFFWFFPYFTKISSLDTHAPADDIVVGFGRIFSSQEAPLILEVPPFLCFFLYDLLLSGFSASSGWLDSWFLRNRLGKCFSRTFCGSLFGFPLFFYPRPVLWERMTPALKQISPRVLLLLFSWIGPSITVVLSPARIQLGRDIPSIGLISSFQHILNLTPVFLIPPPPVVGLAAASFAFGDRRAEALFPTRRESTSVFLMFLITDTSPPIPTAFTPIGREV